MRARTGPKLRALAAGLGVPLEVVQSAAGRQFLGLDDKCQCEYEVRVLVEGFRALTEAGRAEVLALVQAHQAATERRDQV